jgi:hypothetical protein
MQDGSILFEIPCFKCIFWKSERENHLLCNPRECEKLTEWLFELAELCKTDKILVFPKEHLADQDA